MSKSGKRIAVSNRREFLKTAGFAGLAGMAGAWQAMGADDVVTLPFENGERPLVKYPQKRPLIRLTTRPPQLETPFAVFNEGVITPNDAFFVRYHLTAPAFNADLDQLRLQVKGKVNASAAFSVSDLKTRFDPVEIIAVNQCSGNGRGFSALRVPGGQMGNGAMGNAQWKGVRLKDLLERVGLNATARQVTFAGLDAPLLAKTPAFVKALEIDHALEGEVLIAYEMNGQDLPVLNGY